MFYVYCDRPSTSARLLSRAMGAKRLRQHRPLKATDTLINWGCGGENFNDMIPLHKVVNKPELVLNAVNKVKFFNLLKDTKLTVPFTTKKETARSWLEEGRKVICRVAVAAAGGKGIVVAEHPGQLVDARLYTRYIPKDAEWRVHVVNQTVVDFQRKARNRQIPDDKIDWTIRSYDNGFVYIRGGMDRYRQELLDEVKSAGVKAVIATGLDFGAVDILTTKGGRVYVLEVNSAPGIEGSTVDKYAEALMVDHG